MNWETHKIFRAKDNGELVRAQRNPRSVRFQRPLIEIPLLNKGIGWVTEGGPAERLLKKMGLVPASRYQK